MQPCQGGISPHRIRIEVASFSQLESKAGSFYYSFLSLMGVKLVGETSVHK